MLEPSRYLELVRCVVEEGVEGVPLTTHPHVVVERSQLLSDHAVSEHLKTNINVIIGDRDILVSPLLFLSR